MSCKQTTSSDYDRDRIEQILYDIRLAYERNEIDVVMTYFNEDFKHDGQRKWQIEQVWLDRRSEYPLLEFQDVSIDIRSDIAIVSFTMKLEKSGQIVYSDEPAAHGDLSYFSYLDDGWQVYGNQHR